MRYLKGCKWCNSNTFVGVHKNARFKCQPSLPRATLCIKRCTPFMEIDDKGGEISTKILREVGFGHGHGQRGSNIEEWRRIKTLGQEKHTSRGSKLMNLIVAFDMCIFMCLLALHKLLNSICMLVWCMLVVELE